MNTCLRLFVLVAGSLFFLSFSGPVLDHHYAERQPDHAHVYLGQIVPDHVHPYEASHTRLHTQEANGGASGSASPGNEVSSGIVYLSSYDGMGRVFAQYTVPSVHFAPNSPEPGDDLFAFDVPGDDTLTQDAFIAPPKKPPCV